MAAPCGRIFPLAISLGLRCIENRLDAATKPCRRFWLFDPKRFQDSEDCLRVDLINREGPKGRRRRREAPAPLILVFRIAPFLPLRRKQVVGNLSKGWFLCREPPFLLAYVNRIAARPKNPAGFVPGLAGVSKFRLWIERPKTHLGATTAPREAKDPRMGQ